jgi:hypothetical protein
MICIECLRLSSRPASLSLIVGRPETTRMVTVKWSRMVVSPPRVVA